MRDELQAERQKYIKINQNILGRVTKGMRKSKGMTLEQLSIDSDIDIAYLSKLENGLCKPRFDTISNLCHAFDLTIKEFFDCADSYLE